ncbi:hypothetical protein F441_21064, partial [Phytophthora nicotianae CJ01A1]
HYQVPVAPHVTRLSRSTNTSDAQHERAKFD